ncbi:hypothetical protein [Halostreptopolyspora alba]|uniref:hypothetical protein n=1 Tax=Halostreptopolyspora alba TaxID=2487137 RepID=UPI0011CDF288
MTAFSVSLTVPTPADLSDSEAELRAEFEYGDDYEQRVMLACDLLAETDCDFRVRGFGVCWPVDVGYDLSTFLEGLPELLADLRSGREGVCDFYAQGTERVLRFFPEGAWVRITCESRTAWAPDAGTERVGRGELERMLVETAVAFGRSVGNMGLSMAGEEPFASWRWGRV